jgi:hypothetical protein
MPIHSLQVQKLLSSQAPGSVMPICDVSYFNAGMKIRITTKMLSCWVVVWWVLSSSSIA